MTREEFIDYYLSNSCLPAESRTADGFHAEGMRGPWHAVPCDCGEESCQGWAMVPEMDTQLLELARNSSMSRQWWARNYWIPPDLDWEPLNRQETEP